MAKGKVPPAFLKNMDKKMDKKAGIQEGSAKDKKIDKAFGIKESSKKGKK